MQSRLQGGIGFAVDLLSVTVGDSMSRTGASLAISAIICCSGCIMVPTPVDTMVTIPPLAVRGEIKNPAGDYCQEEVVLVRVLDADKWEDVTHAMLSSEEASEILRELRISNFRESMLTSSDEQGVFTADFVEDRTLQAEVGIFVAFRIPLERRREAILMYRRSPQGERQISRFDLRRAEVRIQEYDTSRGTFRSSTHGVEASLREEGNRRVLTITVVDK